MKRNNIWIHIGVAAIFIAIAAILGQIGRWQNSLNEMRAKENASQPEKTPKTIARTRSQSEPEILVRVRPGVTREEFEQAVSLNNDRIEDSIEIVGGLYSVDDMDNADPEELVREYSQMKDIVMFAEPNADISLDEVDEKTKSVNESGPSASEGNWPNDPLLLDQWALKNTGQEGGKAGADINVEDAWQTTHGSEDVVVAVLDTGVDYTHSDLASNMWFRPDNVPEYIDADLGAVNDVYGFDAADNAADPMDENGHGTHCAGIIGAEGNNGIGISGVNWNIKIMPLKFLGRSGFGTTKDAIEAINYAVDRKRNGVNIRVISASWGSTSYSRALEDAIRAAGEEGILFVAAAGNSNTDNDKRPHYPSNYDLPNVTSVAALDRNDDLASFSNFGAKTVHVAAPGKEIVSTWIKDTFREASGTSMATPYVSGIAALVIASQPNIKLDDLRERLIKASDRIDSLGGKVASGGRINAAKALGN
jgi:subtilisin family serine protease